MPFKFYIEDIYTRTEVQEPRGWADLESVFERDFETHGVFFDYTEGTIRLGFACEGKELLEAEYQAMGSSGYYQFEVEEAPDAFSAYVSIFVGLIDFSTRTFNEDIWDAEVNNSNEQLKFKNRKSKEINLNSGEDLDGNAVGNMNYDSSIRLLGSKPRAELNMVGINEVVPTQQSGSTSNVQFIIGLQNSSSAEIKRFSPKRNSSRDTQFDFINFSTFLDLESNAALQMDITWDFDLIINNVSGTAGPYTCILWLASTDEWIDELGANHDSSSIDNALLADGVSANFAGTTTVYANCLSGLKFGFILAIVGAAGEVYDADLTITDIEFNITDVYTNRGEIVQWYRLHDALNKNLSFLTSKRDFLFSNLLGDTTNGYNESGCLSEMFISNGFRIRSITDNKKAPSFSFDDFMENLNAHHAVGYGFEMLDSPTELGHYDIDWISSTSGTGTLRINENVAASITAGSKLGIYDNEFISGVYVVGSSVWGSGYTEITIDISGNNNYYTGVPGVATYTVYLTSDTNTSYRERLRVEKWEHFYGINELLDLGVVEEYSEEPLSDVYSGIKFEFKKYSNDENQALTIEDFHTKGSWSIPIDKTDLTKNLSLSWIGSTGLITESKSNTEIVSPTTSNKLDDDLFFCDKVAKQITIIATFDASAGCIEVMDYAYDNYIYGAATFSVSGSVSNDGTYTIDTTQDPLFSIDTEKYCIYVDEAVTNETIIVTITPIYTGLQEHKPESMENIDSQTGLTVPNYTYSIRRTIKRMLLRWGSFIRSTVSYTPGIGTLKNLLFVNNGDLTTTLDTTNLQCYEDSGVITEDDKIDISELNEPIFKPNVIMATRYLCDTDYEMIKDAHRNKLVYNEQNYGYITVTSPSDGKVVSGWLLNITRSPTNKIAKFKLLERYV